MLGGSDCGRLKSRIDSILLDRLKKDARLPAMHYLPENWYLSSPHFDVRLNVQKMWLTVVFSRARRNEKNPEPILSITYRFPVAICRSTFRAGMSLPTYRFQSEFISCYSRESFSSLALTLCLHTAFCLMAIYRERSTRLPQRTRWRLIGRQLYLSFRP